MILFKLQDQFDRKTGEPDDPRPIFNGLICDWCGHVFEDGYEMPDPVYKVEESGNIEAGWHEDIVLGDEKVDLYELFSTHPEFVYCQDWCAKSNCTMLMVDSWVEQRSVNGATNMGHLKELAYVMYQARYHVIKKLFGEKYTLDQLGLKITE